MIQQAIQKNFKFISDNEDVLLLTKKSFENYRIIQFHFEIITPKSGYVMTRKLDYITTVRQGWLPIVRILTLLVIKHSPDWYYKYVDSFPVKITKLEIKPI